MPLPGLKREKKAVGSAAVLARSPLSARVSDLQVAAILMAGAVVFLAPWLLDLQTTIGHFDKYPHAALRFLAGEIDPERLLDYSPAYLGLCVLIAKYGSANFQLLLWLQIILVALAVAALYLVLRRHFSRALSLGGAAAFMLYPGVTVYCGIFEPEPLMMSCLVLLVLCAGSCSLAGSLGAGSLLTVCLLTRPTFLMLVPLVPLFFWLTRAEGRRWIAIALFLLPIFCSSAVLALRNPALFSSFPPPLMNPGTVFFEGNNPTAGGTFAAYPPLSVDLTEEFPDEVDFDHFIYRLLARRESGMLLNHVETNRYWAVRAVHFIEDEPGLFLARLGSKLIHLWHGYRWHDLKEAYLADLALERRAFPFMPLAPLSALAMCGLVAGLSRWRDYGLYYLAFLSQASVMLLTYASERQRLSLLPFLVLFAVVGLDWLLRRRKRQMIAALALLVPLTVWFLIDSDRMHDNRRNWDNFARQEILQRETYLLRNEVQLAAAAQTLAQTYAAAPWMAAMGIRPMGVPLPEEGLARMALREFPTLRGNDPTARLDRALLLIAAGELDAAERSLNELLHEGRTFDRIIYRPAQPHFYLGRIAALRGQREEAISLMEQALARAPGDPAILAHLEALSGEERYAALLHRYFGKVNALNELAIAHLQNGDATGAAELFRQLVDMIPEFWKGQVQLAASLADSGQDEAAAAVYLQAMAKRPEPVLYGDKLIPAFSRLADRATSDDLAWFWYAKILGQNGEYNEARAILRRLLNAKERPEVRRDLAGLEIIMSRPGLLDNE